MSQEFSTFKLSNGDRRKVQEWMTATVHPAAVSLQKQRFEQSGEEPREIYRDCWEAGIPYEGAIGGGLGYCFYPNGIGMAIIVKHELTGLKLDLSDYGSW